MKKKEKWFDSSIIRDDESKTTENSKHFVLNNGTREAVFSPQSMNYYDNEKKEWKPIDNSLKATDDGYLANLGKYTAKLSKNIDNETVEISAESKLISWKYLGINRNVFSQLGNAIAKPNIKRKSKLKVKTDIKDNLRLTHASRAVYSDAEGNVDLDYSIESNGIKENIVIKEKSDNYHYYFLLRIVGFEIKTAKDGIGLEFYNTVANEEGSEGRIPEFIMPAPFMYDANGDNSDHVKYALEKIEEGVYIFSIEAEAKWINEEKRVFPVYIDPQILTVDNSYITVTHNSYQLCNCGCCEDGSCCESYWMHTGSPYYPYIYLNNDGTYRTVAELHIKKSEIDLTRNRLISAKLIFPQYCSYSSPADVVIGYNTYCHDTGDLTADITGIYVNYSGDFNITMSMSSVGKMRKFYMPTLQIQYQPICDEPILKTFALENGSNAEFDVLTGNATETFDDIDDPVLGVAVSHVYKPNDSVKAYGQNFRLNLNEKLVKTHSSTTGAQYVYTDAGGNVHTFRERFYLIGGNGEKVYISSVNNLITADADGRLWFNNAEVFRELTTDRGLRASARLEKAVNNAEWVEQRIDEEKQAEERVKSYENTLLNFVTVNRETGIISYYMSEDMLPNPDSVESFLSRCGSVSNLLLSKEEALSYKSLITQKKALTTSRSSLELQKDSLMDSAKSLLLQVNSKDSIQYQKDAYYVQLSSLNIELDSLLNAKNKILEGGVSDNESADYNIILHQIDNNHSQKNLLDSSLTLINAQETDLNNQKGHMKNQIRNFSLPDAPTGSNNGTLTSQYNNAQEQINVINIQLDDIDSQLSLYKSRWSKYVTQFKSYYKEYLSLKNQLDKLKMQIPVAYLISDNTVKGFNSNGELVIVQNKYGKYVVVEREKYNSYGETRISAVYDQDGKTMYFVYNGKNKLSEICNSLGERVTFDYDTSDCLTSIRRHNQPALTLSYTTAAGNKRICGIASSDKSFSSLSYSISGKLTKITRNSTIAGITHDSYLTGSATALSTVEMAYDLADTKLTYDNVSQEIYKTNQDTEQVTAHYEVVNGLVTSAEFYTYKKYLLTKTEHAHKSCLNRYSYADFAEHVQIDMVDEVTYNSFNELKKVISSRYALPRTEDDSPIEQNKTEYVYNDNNKLTERRTTHCYCESCEPYDITVAVEKYYYDNTGELVRKESYIEGEELKTGINIEEHVFNDKGAETLSFTYNSLDPSSKFYTENEVDESGKVLYTFDESGEHKTSFDYERDGVTVRTERLPNGSRLSYGRGKDGAVTAITHSTENGEENSTACLRTLDAVTMVKSGNNTVRYTYDNKFRVRTVSLNGTEDYVTYAYSGEHTDSEKVTVTMADATTATTTKNVHGNVTKSTCGSLTVTNTYDDDQQLIKTADSVSGETTLTYDDDGKVITVTSPLHTETFTYDEKDDVLERRTITINGVTHTYEYGYKSTADRSPDSISVDGNTVRPNTDALGRNTGKTIEVGDETLCEEKISYVKFGDHATSLPSTVRFATHGMFGESIQYRYDSMGNITEIFENGRSACRYEYDTLGRLTREDNVSFGKTIVWAYDNNGNIISRYEYAITAKPTSELHLLNCTCVNYAYDDNSDRLMSYNGESFVYDTIGNPTSYRGKTATWAYGRRLTAYDGNTFTYDASGRRTAKNDITFVYDSNGNLIKQSNGLEFFYDHTGVFAVKYNGSTYFYRKDFLSNIVELLDNTGATVVKYKYDAWGNCKVLDATGTEITDNNNIGVLNPFRYRSYYYDTETGFYFLKTRYYDPETGRFTTIDDLSYLDPESINGLNLYAYCNNNPVNFVDPNGTFAITAAIIIGLVAGAVIGGTIGGVVAYNYASANGATGWSLFGKTALGVLGGSLIGAAIGGAIGFATPYIGAFLSSSFPLTAPVMMDGVAGYAVVGTVTGTQIAAAVLGAGLLMFSKGYGPRIGHSNYENKQFDQLVKKHRLTKDEAQRLHHFISHQNYSYHEIEKIIFDFFGK